MPRVPNIIILLLDTARAQSFSGYGYARPTSPHIDAIAAEGVVYEQAIAPGSWSLPSQVGLLTGMFPSKHGAHELHLSYAHRYPLLPEVLREAGYHTLGISSNSWMSDEFGVTRGFERYLKLWQYRHTMPAASVAPTSDMATWLDKKLQWWYWRHVFPRRNRVHHVNQHIRTLLTQTPEPFFLYAIYWDLHLPYATQGGQATRWLPPGVTLSQGQRVNRDPLKYLTGQTPMSEEDFTVLRAFYDGALASLDAEIGALVTWLRQRGMLDRTMLIITSDHGENIGDHGLMSHAYSLHDTLIHVPLIVRYPDLFPAGQRVTHQVQLTDLFPTVLDVLGLDLPGVRQELQGVSLLASPADAPEGRLAYAELLAPHPSMASLNRRTGSPEGTPRPAFDRALRCLRTPTTKMIWASDGNHALYDLRQDPHEMTNLLAAEPKLATEYLDLLDAWHPSTGAPPMAPAPLMAPELRQRLRDLGYLA
jgi:arylsulfatase A-like enzyme